LAYRKGFLADQGFAGRGHFDARHFDAADDHQSGSRQITGLTGTPPITPRTACEISVR
jgi:hypothetical protein